MPDGRLGLNIAAGAHRNRATSIIRALLLAAALLLTGCARTSKEVPAASGIRLQLEVSPARPAALHPASLRLRVSDASGGPYVLQELRAAADMPEMTHGKETIAFRDVAPGLYEAVHTFSMDGRWEIRVSGRTAGGRAEARFTVEVGGR